MHRDIKIENILLHSDPTGNSGIKLQLNPTTVLPKIADLGCAKSTRTRFVCNTPYTGTRWYRSVELLLHDKTYSKPNDIWSIGCIAFEIFTLHPLFQGQSELDMLHMILQAFGPLQEGEWPEYQQLAQGINYVSAVPVQKQKF